MTDRQDASEAYDGVLGAVPYAYHSTDSRLCRLYVVVGGLVALLVAVVFTLAVVTLIGSTAAAPGGLLTSSRAFYVVIALSFLGPTIAPVLLVARRHRHGRRDRRYDRAMAASGFLFVLSLYLGLVASMPPTFQLNGETVTRPPADGPFGPIIGLLYAIPEPAWPVVPALATALMAVIHRLYR